MGNKSTPETIKKLSGTLRTDRIKEGIQFELITKVPKPEIWLSDKGKINFKLIAKMLIDKSMLYNSDVHLLAIMAEEMATYEMACRELKTKEDYIQETQSKYKQQSPWVGIRNQAQKNIRDIGSLFGLDPLSREKFGGNKQKEVKNPFENL